jgi:hypothetical protein
MKIMTAALLAATALAAGLAAGAAPAAAASCCHCPVAYHHPVHRIARHRAVYRHVHVAPPREVVIYETEPQPEPVYEETPFYDVPAYAVGATWYGRAGFERFQHAGFDRDGRERFEDFDRGHFDGRDRGRFDGFDRGRFEGFDRGRFGGNDRGHFDGDRGHLGRRR